VLSFLLLFYLLTFYPLYVSYVADLELVTLNFDCTADALKSHERANAFNLVLLKIGAKSDVTVCEAIYTTTFFIISMFAQFVQQCVVCNRGLHACEMSGTSIQPKKKLKLNYKIKTK